MKIFTNDSTRRKFASIFKRSRALMGTASGRTSVSVAEDRSLTTSACVSLARFAEPIFLSLLRKNTVDGPTLPGSSVSLMVTPKSCSTRVLLLGSESSLQVEVRDALQAQLRADDPSIFF